MRYTSPHAWFKCTDLSLAEAMLVTLIDTFTFELVPEKEIYWNISVIFYPTVGPEDLEMQLPLRVALAK